MLISSCSVLLSRARHSQPGVPAKLLAAPCACGNNLFPEPRTRVYAVLQAENTGRIAKDGLPEWGETLVLPIIGLFLACIGRKIG